MKDYELIKHTADVKIRIFGETRRHLFENGIKALSECLRPELGHLSAKEKVRIFSEEGIDTLLVDFLNEVNFLSEVNREVYLRARFEELTDKKVVADLFGKEVKRFGVQVKAVTFNELRVEKKEKGWEAEVVLDI